MAAPHASILRCSIGGTEFQCDGYGYTESPVMEGGKGRTGTRAVVRGTGWIDAPDVATLRTRLTAAVEAMRPGGQTFTIHEHNALLLRLPSTGARFGGPHVELVLEPDGQNPLHKRMAFTVTAEYGSTGVPGEDAPSDDVTENYDSAIEYNAAGLRTITRRGTISGPGAGTHWQGTVIPTLRAAYPWPDWVISHRAEFDFSNVRIRYELTATELSAPLPGVGTTRAVDGTAASRADKDESGRVTRTMSFDLVVDGDPSTLVNSLRPAGDLLRESVSTTTTPDLRVQVEFAWLESRDGDWLVAWEQTLEAVDSEDSQVEVGEYAGGTQFPGAAPILYWAPKHALRYVQRGRAVALGRWVKPAEPIFDPPRFTSTPSRSFRPLDPYGIERETTWQYEMAALAPGPLLTAADLDKLLKPTGVQFYV